MAQMTTFTVLDKDGEELDQSTLTSDGCPPARGPWLRWIDYSKGEINLEALPDGARRIKVSQN